jgi:hypothetical protein
MMTEGSIHGPARGGGLVHQKAKSRNEFLYGDTTR